MPQQPVQGPIAADSSWIKAATYSNGVLAISTKKGALITLIGVPSRVWEEYQAATSKGEFYNRQIKGKFKQI
jgi:hypothetical protein